MQWHRKGDRTQSIAFVWVYIAAAAASGGVFAADTWSVRDGDHEFVSPTQVMWKRSANVIPA